MKQNYEVYTKQQIDRATQAHCLQGMIGHPLQCDFETLIQERMIQNYPVTHHDVINAYKII